ncbi:hypothetical protein M9H77_19835 [Catharanthus roseus]|uniref:Uncharacterized protein n=1 Tax=Catharanthus roseus TaxID=4058 RepID=A0ACC0BBJ0_CATRO|nr:hypothetical protein M9H77_19835 [Catharanthus roseus]
MAIVGVGVSSSRLMVSGVAVVPVIRYVRKLITTTPPPIQEDQLCSDPAVAQERPVVDKDEVYDSSEKAPRSPGIQINAAPSIGPINKGPPRSSTENPGNPPV